jgi:K+-sensing histidine kinase KdpD|tara:strand:- start:335 stop:532 length:198 start_codon:yes stop_codon:yes gene_type:complete
MYKALIFFLIFAMLISLFSGAFFLIKDRGTTKRTTYSLGIRVSIALMLFATLIYGFLTGEIGPNA